MHIDERIHRSRSTSVHIIWASASTALLVFLLNIASISSAAEDLIPWSDVPMPVKSNFYGMDPPSDKLKWAHAQNQASSGEQVLLKAFLKAITNPLDLIHGKTQFKDVHRMGDVFLSKATGGLKVLSTHRSARPPIALFGYRTFGGSNHEGVEHKFSGFAFDAYSNALGNMPRKMVVIGSMDENWGYVSTYYRNRTANWGIGHGPQGGDPAATDSHRAFLRRFLDDPNVLMMMSNQHFNITHPKVISFPLGVIEPRMNWDVAHRVLRRGLRKDPTHLLFSSGSDWGSRPAMRECIARNLGSSFESHGKKVGQRNPFTPAGFMMKVAQSVAVLCLPGFGYDTYRLWETLSMGSIPVLERGVGLDRTLWKLPALLVDDFADLTAALIQSAYVEALYRAEEWEYERLTTKWWRDTVFQVAARNSTDFLLERHPMKAVDVGFTRPLDYFNCDRMGGCGGGTLRTPYNVCNEFNATLGPRIQRR